MGFAEALHHSSGSSTKKMVEWREGPEGEVRETHDGLRAQERPLPGTRPAPLSVGAKPQGRLEAAARVSAGVPSVAPPALADTTADGVDSSTLRFLATAALYSRKLEEEEEEKVKREEEEEELRRLWYTPLNQLTIVLPSPGEVTSQVRTETLASDQEAHGSLSTRRLISTCYHS